MAVDELIDVLGRGQIETVLRLSAEGVAGPPHPGKKGQGQEDEVPIGQAAFCV